VSSDGRSPGSRKLSENSSEQAGKKNKRMVPRGLSVATTNRLMHRIASLQRITSKRGRPRLLSDAYALHLILFVCRSGSQWSALDALQLGFSYKTVYHRFALWSKARIFEGAFYETVQENVLAERPAHLVVDTTHVKNVFGRENLGRNHADRARKSTKIALLTDQRGMPLAATFHPGNRNDCKTLPHLLCEAWRKIPAFSQDSTLVPLLADKAYATMGCRNAATEHSLNLIVPPRGIREGWAVGRWVIERTFAWLDLCRRVKERFDSRMHAFKSFTFLSALRLF
jgi:transposase